jgi:hypothetical protein
MTKKKFLPDTTEDRKRRRKSFRKTKTRVLATLSAITEDSVDRIRAITDDEWKTAADAEVESA